MNTRRLVQMNVETEYNFLLDMAECFYLYDILSTSRYFVLENNSCKEYRIQTFLKVSNTSFIGNGLSKIFSTHDEDISSFKRDVNYKSTKLKVQFPKYQIDR